MVRQSESYMWVPKTLSEAHILVKKSPRRSKNREELKMLIDNVKALLKKSHKGEERRELATAGLCLNKLLMR